MALARRLRKHSAEKPSTARFLSKVQRCRQSRCRRASVTLRSVACCSTICRARREQRICKSCAEIWPVAGGGGEGEAPQVDWRQVRQHQMPMIPPTVGKATPLALLSLPRARRLEGHAMPRHVQIRAGQHANALFLQRQSLVRRPRALRLQLVQSRILPQQSSVQEGRQGQRRRGDVAAVAAEERREEAGVGGWQGLMLAVPATLRRGVLLEPVSQLWPLGELGSSSQLQLQRNAVLVEESALAARLAIAQRADAPPAPLALWKARRRHRRSVHG
eukprot:scaffold139_cov246-Pinguiococcus_pyrenoidosus.AAC.14